MKKMKNNVLKYYIATFYLCSTLTMFAQPGDGSDSGDLEAVDPVPTNNYLWVLALLALVVVFMKIRTLQKNRV